MQITLPNIHSRRLSRLAHLARMADDDTLDYLRRLALIAEGDSDLSDNDADEADIDYLGRRLALIDRQTHTDPLGALNDALNINSFDTVFQDFSDRDDYFLRDGEDYDWK